MPEGPEVKLSADLIRPLLVGKFVRKTTVGSNSRYAKNAPEGQKEFHDSFRIPSDININMVEKCIITDVSAKGKFMYWTFDNGWYMFSTFGMTGQWSPTAGKHVCLQYHLYDLEGELHNMFYNDPRHFGTIKFTNKREDLRAKLNELGWDPLNYVRDDVWDNFIINHCARSSKPIGQLLMDQSIFAGVGNYIRAEALYLAKISPWTPSNKLSRDEIKVLCQACVDVMRESYNHQGATIQTYKTAYGEEGRYSSLFKVYGKKVDPLGNSIIKEDTPDGRTIHWCPTVQK